MTMVSSSSVNSVSKLFTGEAEPGRPYWWDGIEWPDLSASALPADVDLLVIGAGYCGLSAAIAGQDAGATVAVIDAGVPGHGASTRNGGMVGAHPRLSWEALQASFGAPTADALFREAKPALDWVCDLIAREGIDCDLEQTGRIQLAYTPKHFDAQRRLCARVQEKSSVQCEMVAKADLASEIKTNLYHGGLLFPEHRALHPAKYHQGLLQAVLRRDVPVIANCAALSVDRAGTAFQVRTAQGLIKAEKVLLATNGYTKSPFHWFARRVFPLPSFLIATEPLSSNVIGDLAPGKRMMVETRARHSYFRVSPDGSRILFGGRASMAQLSPEAAAERLHVTMTQIWPELEGVKLSHAWTGNTGYSFSHMPTVGEQDGLHYAMGFSGSGTVMAPYLGAKAALRALRAPGGETAYAHTRFRTRWFHPFGPPHFLKAADLWYRTVVDRRENQEAKTD